MPGLTYATFNPAQLEMPSGPGRPESGFGLPLGGDVSLQDLIPALRHLGQYGSLPLGPVVHSVSGANKFVTDLDSAGVRPSAVVIIRPGHSPDTEIPGDDVKGVLLNKGLVSDNDSAVSLAMAQRILSSLGIPILGFGNSNTSGPDLDPGNVVLSVPPSSDVPTPALTSELLSALDEPGVAIKATITVNGDKGPCPHKTTRIPIGSDEPPWQVATRVAPHLTASRNDPTTLMKAVLAGLSTPGNALHPGLGVETEWNGDGPEPGNVLIVSSKSHPQSAGGLNVVAMPFVS